MGTVNSNLATIMYNEIERNFNPNNRPSGRITSEENEILCQATFYYMSGDICSLEDVYKSFRGAKSSASNATSSVSRDRRVVSRPVASRPAVEKKATSLIEFFRNKGLEVIDKRDKGGCLWVVGSREEIGAIVREAGATFHAGGNYAPNGGRATGYRTAWFTQCAR